MTKINVGIIGRNFGYKLIYHVIQRVKKFNTIAFCFKNKGDLSENLKRYKELLSSKNINRKECILLPFNALKKGLINGN